MLLVNELSVELRQYIEEYYFIFVLANVVLYITYLAWRLSSRPALSYNVHLIQTFQSPTSQQVQIINADPERLHGDELVNLIIDENNQSERSTETSTSDYHLRIRALVVRSPLRSSEPQNSSLSQETTTINLPLHTNRHISEIYRTIQHYTDSSIAGAVVVSLFRRFSRRLSNQNHLQISQLLNEVVGAETGVVQDQYAFTVSIPDGETTSTDSSTLSSTMSTPTTSEATAMPSNEFAQAINEDLSSQVPTPKNETPQTEPAIDGDEQSIRLKFLDDTETVVRTKLAATVLEFKKAQFPEQVLAGKTIRLIFRGQLLRDNNRSLESYGLQDNCIVHCHINNKPYAQSAGQSSNANNSSNSSEQPTFVNQIPQRPVFDDDTWFTRAMQMGIYYADAVPFFMFYAMTSCLAWIRDAEHAQEDPRAPFVNRQMTRFRRCLHRALRVFVDFTEQPNVNEDMFSNRFNLGVLFTLLFAVKFASIWLVVFYFPQYTDVKGIFILLVLTIVFGLYTFHNRPMRLDAPQHGNNELHIQ